MIAATTPIDLAAELSRLLSSWTAGNACLPQFSYHPRQDHRDLISSLENIAEALEHEGPLGQVYADRARELAMEAFICSTVGLSSFRTYARQRFSRRDRFDGLADALVQDWLDEPFEQQLPDPSDLVSSDDPQNARSLLVRLRSEMGARKIPFRVVVARDSSALAATGDSFVQIAAGRTMTITDVERTVLHEMEGHVMPRCRANTQPIGIFALGTRFGIDDQEGRALCIERRNGYLDGARRRELAFRHLAARLLEQDADFVQAARTLLDRGAPHEDALRITARVFRGGGLGREVVYLPAFLRIDAALAQDPGIDDVLGAGRVAVATADVLRSWVREMH